MLYRFVTCQVCVVLVFDKTSMYTPMHYDMYRAHVHTHDKRCSCNERLGRTRDRNPEPVCTYKKRNATCTFTLFAPTLYNRVVHVIKSFVIARIVSVGESPSSIE